MPLALLPASCADTWVARGLDLSGAVEVSVEAFLPRRGIGCEDGVREAAAGGTGVRRVTTMEGVMREEVHQADYTGDAKADVS